MLMRALCCVFSVLVLGGCTTHASMDRQRFMADYRPLDGSIPQVSAALDLDYRPRFETTDIAALNRSVNRVPYKDGHGVLNPDAFWAQGGDCDMYALIKLLELRARGTADLYYMVLTGGPKGDSHAVLVTTQNGAMVALDNRTDAPLPVTALYRDYKPAYLVDGRSRQIWVSRAFEADLHKAANIL